MGGCPALEGFGVGGPGGGGGWVGFYAGGGCRQGEVSFWGIGKGVGEGAYGCVAGLARLCRGSGWVGGGVVARVGG